MKTIFEDSEKCLSEDDKHLSEDKNCLDQDINTDPPRPMTRALQKIIHFKKAAAVAVSLIQYELEPECDVNMFAEKYDKYPCPNCYKDVKNFAHFSGQANLFLNPQNLIQFAYKTKSALGIFVSALCD